MSGSCRGCTGRAAPALCAGPALGSLPRIVRDVAGAGRDGDPIRRDSAHLTAPCLRTRGAPEAGDRGRQGRPDLESAQAQRWSRPGRSASSCRRARGARPKALWGSWPTARPRSGRRATSAAAPTGCGTNGPPGSAAPAPPRRLTSQRGGRQTALARPTDWRAFALRTPPSRRPPPHRPRPRAACIPRPPSQAPTRGAKGWAGVTTGFQVVLRAGPASSGSGF